MEENTTNAKRTFYDRAVVFYNVENLFDTINDPLTNDSEFTPFGEKQWDEERYELKLNHLSEAISLIEKNPVLVGLSEVENYKVLEDLIATNPLNEINFGIAHFNSPDTRGIDCALLFDKTIFELISKQKLPVTLMDNEDFKTRDILYVKGRMDNVEVHVFVNHWPSRREGQVESEHKRIRAAEVLRAKVTQLLKENNEANIIILGDFNDEPNNFSLNSTLRAKESGFANEDDLVNLSFDNLIINEGTTKHEQEWIVFDQIIVSQAIYDYSSGIGVKGNDAETLDSKTLLYTYPDGGQKPNSTYGGRKYFGGYSDHLPVYILLK